MGKILNKIKELGFEVPPAPAPVGSYVPWLKTGNIVFLSGQLSKKTSGDVLQGRLGSQLSVEQGKEAARLAVLSALSIIESGPGLDSVTRILKVAGYVQTAPDFYAISDVLNGASDLLLNIFGDKGKHVRCALGVHSLPLNAAVEIELTAEIRE